MLCIGVTGRGKSGKSTIARAIAKEAAKRNRRAEVFEISSYVMRDAVQQKLIRDVLRDDLLPEEVQQLVNVGMQRREENPDHWIDLMKTDIRSKAADVSVVPNLRFINEAQAIRDLGGIIIRTTTFAVDGVEWISRDRNPNDVSETEHYRIQADHFLTTLRGQSELLKRQAATLFNYLIEEFGNVN